jgi:hypothetical protein
MGSVQELVTHPKFAGLDFPFWNDGLMGGQGVACPPEDVEKLVERNIALPANDPARNTVNNTEFGFSLLHAVCVGDILLHGVATVKLLRLVSGVSYSRC